MVGLEDDQILESMMVLFHMAKELKAKLKLVKVQYAP